MKTKILILKTLLLFYFLLSAFNSFSQNWQWARQIGGIGNDAGGVKIDANNNMYCGGRFNTNCYFDQDTLYPVGFNDLFLAKYDVNGNELWAKRIGGNNPYNMYEYGGVSGIDNNNACLYFAGNFYGTITIDGHTVNSSGGADMFLAKFDLDGNCIWLIKAGGYFDDRPGAVCLDNIGNIYWAGVLGGIGYIDTINLTHETFLAKIDQNGNVLWARDEINDGWPSALKIRNNELILSGVTINDTAIIDTSIMISTNNMDGFIARLDTNGNCIKAKRFKGEHIENATGDFELDLNNIYVSGFFSDNITIDGFTMTNNNGQCDMFFCKLDSALNLIWARQSNSTGNNGAIASGVIKDSEGKFYLSGYFSGNATFGTYNEISSVTSDMFLARYDENGNCIGIRHFGEAQGGSINIDSNGDLIVAGNFMNSVNIGSTILTSYGDRDMFFAKTSPITGITEVGKTTNNSLLIYSNPTTGKCNITVPDDFVNEKNLTLNIFDNSGKLIQQQKLEMNENKIKLDLEQEAKGIYNVTLSDGKKVYEGKIVFE